MIKSKKQMYIVIAVFLVVLLLGTTTYAFFNYTRTGTANVIRTGRIAFNSTQGTAISLTNLFPIDVSEGIPEDNTKVGTLTVNITGDTEYTGGIEYLVSAVNVSNTVGNKQLPISIDVSVVSNTGNNPASNLGTENEYYFLERGSDTSYYKVLASDVIEDNDQIVVGYIAPGQSGVDGNITIKAYIDKEKIAISDTYPSGIKRKLKSNFTSEDIETCKSIINYSSEEQTTAFCNGTGTLSFYFGTGTIQEALDNNYLTSNQINDLVDAGLVIEYNDGTTDEWVGERVVFTTEEWNSFQSSGARFQIKVEANQGTWAKNSKILCKRVTSEANLHTEKCINTSTIQYCQADGYDLNDTITYGNAVSLGTSTLIAGDAFDCDVNGNGQIDVDGNNQSTERFYYVSPYYDTELKTFDTTYATLIYYDITNKDSLVEYCYRSYGNICIYGCNWFGPENAISKLKTSNEWNNVKLKKNKRAILAESPGNHNSPTTTVTTNQTYTYTLPTEFSYSGYASRLLTAKELMEGCGLSDVGNRTPGELSNCQFLLENTKYADSNKTVSGTWLETPQESTVANVFTIDSAYRYVALYRSRDLFGIRQVIDVPMNRIDK